MIGLLGGSFDPVHTGHLAMADAFADALAIDELRFLPASRPWQKHALSASSADRLAMLRLALEHHRAPYGRYAIDTRELARAGATFTIDTLRDLRRELGDEMPLVFLFGADQLVHLDTWNEWEGLWALAHLAAVTRPGFDSAHLPPAVERAWSSRLGDAAALHARPAGASFLLEGLSVDVSATDIRASLGDDDARAAAPFDGLVPPAVLDYIRANHLYRN